VNTRIRRTAFLRSTHVFCDVGAPHFLVVGRSFTFYPSRTGAAYCCLVCSRSLYAHIRITVVVPGSIVFLLPTRAACWARQRIASSPAFTYFRLPFPPPPGVTRASCARFSWFSTTYIHLPLPRNTIPHHTSPAARRLPALSRCRRFRCHSFSLPCRPLLALRFRWTLALPLPYGHQRSCSSAVSFAAVLGCLPPLLPLLSALVYRFAFYLVSLVSFVCSFSPPFWTCLPFHLPFEHQHTLPARWRFGGYRCMNVYRTLLCLPRFRRILPVRFLLGIHTLYLRWRFISRRLRQASFAACNAAPVTFLPAFLVLPVAANGRYTRRETLCLFSPCRLSPSSRAPFRFRFCFLTTFAC